jgi:membrane-associated phospholipid phosphatase
MAMASALANYYSESEKTRMIAYGWAAYVMASATFGFQGDVHWASDVVAGGLMGWAIGRTVGRAFAQPEGTEASKSTRVEVRGYGAGVLLRILI